MLIMSFSRPVQGQTYIDLQDNLDISGNSWIIFNPGTYYLPDPGNDGLVRINNSQNIILDGANVIVDGGTYSGYMIKINNSRNITIRNFESASHFKYAVYITNSDSIFIHDCNFSYNKVDSSGWINVWSDYQSALGGGVMMYQTDYADIYNNTMKFQNDGVALYRCNHIRVWENDFDWNTSFGIRMYFTDSCHIHHNLASHINRPYTNPSDCAAILLIVSNENLVEHNDFSYSGDGIFLGQFQYSSIPNNNVFLYNECSYSPHNAIEATFADGNVYKHNICNYSHYGFWLGYSFNSLVDSNEIIGNQSSGIAVDRGFNNTFTHNVISENPIGIELWEGSGIPPYQNQFSHDYFIRHNEISGNRLAIKADNTEHLVLEYNGFLHNQDGVQFSGLSTQDTITQNLFRNSSLYHLENLSPYDIYAVNNTFFAPDEAAIECSLYDKSDDPSKGEIIWHPFNYSTPPSVSIDQWEDMTEPPAQWHAYPEVCWGYGGSLATTVTYDYIDFKAGTASVQCVTGNGWDIALQFWPGGDSIVHWQLSEADTLIFWLKTENTSAYGFQYHHIRVGNLCGGYYKYTASAGVLNAANGNWRKVRVPLAGGGSPYNYSRTTVGEVSLDDISYVSVHADTWDYGFKLWLDGMHFSSFPTSVPETEGTVPGLVCFPNPAGDRVNLVLEGIGTGSCELAIMDVAGRVRHSEQLGGISPDRYNHDVSLAGLPAGIYLVIVKTEGSFLSHKLVVE